MKMNIIPLREELINYFCHLLPKSVSITYNEKEIDQIIKDHSQQQVKVEPVVRVQIAEFDIHKILVDAEATKQADKLYQDIETQKAFIKGHTEAREKMLQWYKSNLSA